MANPDGMCVVCGARPTVKAHLFPRALMLDLRAAGSHLIEGSRHRNGVIHRQNGMWDDRYVCKVHEDEAGAGDDYVIDFCRRFDEEAKPIHDGQGFSIANPRPDLLVHFVYAVVWRQVVSPSGQALRQNLGPYRAHIEAVLFAAALPTLQVIVSRNGIVAGTSGRVKVAIAPYQQRLRDWRVWHFTMAGFDFYLKTDKRPFPAEWAPYIANGRDPLQLGTTGPIELAGIPMLQPTFARMMNGRLG